MSSSCFSSAMFVVEGENPVSSSFFTQPNHNSSCTLSTPEHGCLWPEQAEEEAGRGSRLLLVSGCAFTAPQGLRKWRKDFVRVLRAPAKRWEFAISKQWHQRVLNRSNYNQGLEEKKINVTWSTSGKPCIGMADHDSEYASHFARVTQVWCKSLQREEGGTK